MSHKTYLSPATADCDDLIATAQENKLQLKIVLLKRNNLKTYEKQHQ